MSFRKLVNTRQFSEAATDFKNNKGHYTMAPVGSRDYIEYWDRQEERCMNGFKCGDLWIPGRHYFYLNFTPILKVPDEHLLRILKESSDKRGKIGAVTMEKVLEFPRFYEIDYEWYRYKHIAWHGGKFQGIFSPGAQHICCAKARNAGFSYKEASDGVYNYTFIPDSKSYYFAGLEQYLNVDGILNKVEGMLDFINGNIHEWKQNRMKKSTTMHQTASYVDETGAANGNNSQIIGVVVDNPNKTRGKRGRKIVFEEGGSFKKLKEALAVSIGSIADGGITVGQISVFGCVCAGTEVYKANGERVLIEDIKQEDGILGYDGLGISKQKISWMQPPARKECVEITLETGIKLRCSIDHPILTTSKALKERKQRLQKRRVKFKRADSVCLGDMLAVIEEVPVFGQLKTPFAYSTGYLIGDGYYCSSIEVIIDNNHSLDRIGKEVGLTPKRKHTTQVGGYADSYTVSGPIRQYLKGNGMFGQSKQAKRFPVDWEQYDKQSLAELLAGYFDADGNCKKDKTRGVAVIYSSVVLELVQTTQRALLKFGIHAALTKERSVGGHTDAHDIYRLYITRAESVERFRQEIPILNPSKIVPAQNKRVNKLLRNAEMIKGSESIALSGKLLTGAVLYSVISVVAIGEQDIYNLTAAGTHTYLSNNIITHNTGGEEGPSIEGLEDIFTQPDIYNMLEFKNVWEEGFEDTLCGYFVPTTKTNVLCMGPDGNIDLEGALAYEMEQRALKEKAKDPKEIDRRKSEYPIYPSEVFQRMMRNPFNTGEIDRQIKRIETNSGIRAILRYGELVSKTTEEGGGWEFLIKTKADACPIEEYPHNQKGSLEGCVTLVERPWLNHLQKTPDGIYQIVFDPFYKEESEDMTSLFACYVMKQYNQFDTINENTAVAWAVMRPVDINRCYRVMFALADWYNCNVQGEIAGGGQGVLDYARRMKLLHKLDFELEMTDNKEVVEKKNRSYLMNMPTEKKRMGLTYLVQDHMEQRGIDEAGNAIHNIHREYDIGYLRELRKFDGKRNADRISARLIWQFSRREKIDRAVRGQEERDGFYNRELFGTNQRYPHDEPEFLTMYEEGDARGWGS